MPVIPPEQSQQELRDHPLSEGKESGFSSSSNCRITQTHIKLLHFTGNDNIDDYQHVILGIC